MPAFYEHRVALDDREDAVAHHEGVVCVELLNLDDTVTLMEHHWNLGGDVAGSAPSQQCDAKADEQRTDNGQNRHPSIANVLLVVGHSQYTLSLCDYVKQSQYKFPRHDCGLA